MKLRTALLGVIAVSLALATSASAQYIYDNGPINGTTDGWTINFGFVVSDTFTISSGGATVTGMSFGAWLEPGDTLQSAEVSVTSSEFGGTSYFDQTINFSQSACVSNQYGFDVCTETGVFNGGLSLNGGNYWLNLQNASTAFGDPVYWDENSGPSMASENSIGTIPSESFSLLGACEDGKAGCGPPVPEPSSLLLLGSGILAVTGLVRMRMRR